MSFVEIEMAMETPITVFGKLKSYWNKYGAARLAKKVLIRICSPVFSYHPLNFYGIVGLPANHIQTRCLLEISKADINDIDLMAQLLETLGRKDARNEVRTLFASGGEAFLVFCEGNLAHLAWLHLNPGISQAFPLVTITDDEAFIGRCDTHPGFRGKSIYPAVLQYMIKYAVQKNKKKCFISCAPDNSASIKGIEKAGFLFAGTKQKFKFFGITFNNQWSSSEAINQN